jgi:hypothetical protein
VILEANEIIFIETSLNPCVPPGNESLADKGEDILECLIPIKETMGSYLITMPLPLGGGKFKKIGCNVLGYFEGITYCCNIFLCKGQ